MKHPTSVRLPALTVRQLEELISSTGMTQSEVITTALDRMHQQENKTMTSKTSRNMIVHEFDTGNTRTVDATPIHEDKDFEFGQFIVEDGPDNVAYVHYWQTGTIFTTIDWQGQQPDTLDEIPDYRWISDDGKDAIVLDGLPRLLE